jgi:hypothetical protein
MDLVLVVKVEPQLFQQEKEDLVVLMEMVVLQVVILQFLKPVDYMVLVVDLVTMVIVLKEVQKVQYVLFGQEMLDNFLVLGQQMNNNHLYINK